MKIYTSPTGEKLIFEYPFNDVNVAAKYDFQFQFKIQEVIDFQATDPLNFFNRDNVEIHWQVESTKYPGIGQYQQDSIVLAYFKDNLQYRTYIDIGASDGISWSNTYILEKQFNWSGLLVEPLRSSFDQLTVNRNVTSNYLLNNCVYNETKLYDFIQVDKEKYGNLNFHMMSGIVDSWRWKEKDYMENVTTIPLKMPCFHIMTILNAYNLTYVDYLSINAEGADFVIVKAIDWNSFTAAVVSIEFESEENKLELQNFFLKELNYVYYIDTGQDLMFFKELKPSREKFVN